MWRVLGIVDRMGHTLTDAATTLAMVLEAMDAEMAALQIHLDNDAAQLRHVVETAHISESERAELMTATDRIEATALRVASFAHRHAAQDVDLPEGSA